MAYKHLIWDWNGTLFDDAWLSLHTVNTLLAEEGHEVLTAEGYATRFGWPLEDYYRDLGFEFDAASFAALCERWYAVYRAREPECRLRARAADTLAAAAEKGVTQSVLSAYQHDPLQRLVRDFGLAGYFDPVIGLAPDEGLSKVAKGKAWFESTGLGRHEAFFIGDTLHDLEVAEAIGVDCILVASGHQTPARLKAGGVPVVESLPEVLGYLS